MIHYLTDEILTSDTYRFTDPFRYTPHPLVIRAAEAVIERINSDPTLASDFSEGKMLGVLICHPERPNCHPERPNCHPERSEGSPIHYISAFSGNVGGQGTIHGFVPPIFDLTNPDGEFKKREAEISSINEKISMLTQSEHLTRAELAVTNAESERDKELGLMKEAIAAAKDKRKEMRTACTDPDILANLVKESQHEKAELRRLKQSWDVKIAELHSQKNILTEEIEEMKRLRASMSESLQEWIFRQYIVHNASGEEASIAEIFADKGLVPPGGTGECAAPKLLEYAYRNGLKPIAMGEFWYGASPDTAVRTHGHFYPSCTSKCGPLLTFMTKGLEIHTEDSHSEKTKENPVIIHEDNEIIIVEKPSGMPSVPGLDGRLSLQEWLEQNKVNEHIHPVHRLDMDTSGIMLFAKTHEAAVILRRQFEEHSIQKTYMARLSGVTTYTNVSAIPSAGSISLPLSPDYDERPRQKVDFKQGKPAYTEYETVSYNSDGTTDILLHPHTGRTHQLRIHCAHTLGLGLPILGDLLYGAHSVTSNATTAPARPMHTAPSRLHLHALTITFRHPSTGENMTFTSDTLRY